MTRLKKNAPPTLVVVLVAGTIGDFLDWTSSERERASQLLAAQQDQAKHNDGAQAEANGPKTPVASTVKVAQDRDVYYPGADELAPNEALRHEREGSGVADP